MDILKSLLGIITGGATTIGGTAANIGAFAALVVALTPLTLSFFKHRDEVLVSITIGDAAFWGAIMGAFVFVIVKLAYRAPHP